MLDFLTFFTLPTQKLPLKFLCGLFGHRHASFEVRTVLVGRRVYNFFGLVWLHSIGKKVVLAWKPIVRGKVVFAREPV